MRARKANLVLGPFYNSWRGVCSMYVVVVRVLVHMLTETKASLALSIFRNQGLNAYICLPESDGKVVKLGAISANRS